MAFPLSPVNNQIAIVNGITYIYNSTNGTWTRKTYNLNGSSVTYSTTPPAVAGTIGDRWVDTNDGTEYVWFTTDGTNFQWVDFSTPTVNTFSLIGGTSGSIPYQLTSSNTGFISIGTPGQILSVSGLTPAWVNQSTLSIANTQITGSFVASQLAYSTGSTGQVLTVNGLNTSWSNAANLNFGTGAILISKGSTAQRPAGVGGYLRFNTDINQFEGYDGAAWASVGGSAISDDNSTTSYIYPLFSANTTGTALTVKTSSAGLLYKPSTGELQADVITVMNGIIVNSKTVSANITIPVGYSAMSSGPITVANNVSVTVSSGSRWVIV
jgi:hypothetical protein